jgi:hypothetical protein
MRRFRKAANDRPTWLKTLILRAAFQPEAQRTVST